MENNSIYKILFLIGIILLFLGCSNKNSRIPVNNKDTSFIDSVITNTYGIMSEEEFEKEMLKGVQGDLTLDQVDSINQQLMKENYYMRVR